MDQTLNSLSINVIFIKILNIIFNLKLNIKKFCSCDWSAGCLTYHDHFFSELHFSQRQRFPPARNGWCENCIFINNLSEIDFCFKTNKFMKLGHRGV